MTDAEGGDATGQERFTGRAGHSVRHWAPYAGLATVVFAIGAAWGAVTGAAPESAFVPAVAGGSSGGTATFLSLVSVAAVMIVGGVFVALPTVALLGLQGYQFGGSLATLARTTGTADAVALAAPAAALAVPALVLVAALPLRALHYASRMILDEPAPAVPTERLVAEAVAIVAVAVVALYLATTLAAGAAT
jgi:hypothetical protein